MLTFHSWSSSNERILMNHIYDFAHSWRKCFSITMKRVASSKFVNVASQFLLIFKPRKENAFFPLQMAYYEMIIMVIKTGFCGAWGRVCRGVGSIHINISSCILWFSLSDQLLRNSREKQFDEKSPRAPILQKNAFPTFGK